MYQAQLASGLLHTPLWTSFMHSCDRLY